MEKTVEQLRENINRIETDMAKRYLDSLSFDTIIFDLMEQINDKEELELKSTLIQRVYFAGGTLCLDMSGDILIMININGETYSVTRKGETVGVRLISIRSMKRLFSFYLKFKNNHDYVMNCFLKSSVKWCYSSFTYEELCCEDIEEYRKLKDQSS